MKKYDVIVIGGGPAGMMAAGQAAKKGAKVLLLEKNDSLGKKLLITGGGRCNVTNAEFDTRALLSKFKDNDRFLFSPFAQFGVQDTFDFFNALGMEIKIEAEKRAFPKSNSSQSVWNALVQHMKMNGVEIRPRAEVKGFKTQGTDADKKIVGVILAKDEVLEAEKYILATGGKSRPETGSTGDGFKWLREIGHKVTEPEPSLVPLEVRDEWVRRLQGLALADAKLSLFQNNVKQESNRGKMLFTHFGLTGPAVLNMSKDVSELLKYGAVEIGLDAVPSLDYGQLNVKLQEIFAKHSNKRFKNSLADLVPSTFAPVVVEKSGIDPEKYTNLVTREERLALANLLKDMRMSVSGLLGVEKAIVTSGGVALEEVDFKTMQSRLFPNLYLIGDILDIDRPSGGYSLQLCWTTGFVAGSDAGVV